MEILEKIYCRFCAERKRPDKMLDLDKDIVKFEEISKKLLYLNATHVDFVSLNSLPKTVCFVCWDSLNKACDFLDQLKEAQTILANIHRINNCFKSDVSDDDITANFDDFFLPEAINDSEPDKIKGENTKRQPNKSSKVQASSDIGSSDVKIEPKEESDHSVEVAMDHSSPESSENLDQSLNVQTLLDVAMGENSFTSNVEIYAKEVPVKAVSKKSIKKWKDYPWVCRHCNNEFKDMNTLRMHSKGVHNNCAPFTCIDCTNFDKGYDFDAFVAHIRRHRKNLRNLCPYCDFKSENLADHIKTHFQKAQRACQLCGEILKNEDAYQKHKKQYNPVKTRKPRRKRGTPITMEDLTCKTCNKVYKNLNSLRDHNKLHISDRKRNYTCDRCGKTFFNKGTLTTHIMAHDNIKPHLCKICNKTFLFPNMLRRHVEMHTGVKPYSCEQCGRCFRLQYQLNAHKIVHTDSLPYICQYCSKAFRFKQILKNHERQHTGAKPYSCQICSMEFTNWSNYNKHMKRRHNTDTSKKKITPEGTFPINPETGQLMQIEDPVGTEEWKNKIMIPGRRGKKKTIKQESAIK